MEEKKNFETYSDEYSKMAHDVILKLSELSTHERCRFVATMLTSFVEVEIIFSSVLSKEEQMETQYELSHMTKFIANKLPELAGYVEPLAFWEDVLG